MEEQVERKDATTAPKEPRKSEELPQGNETSERSDGAASPPPNCSICLGKLVNKSFTDSCLHQFCFSCLLQWSKIKTECPLCKQTFKSIIHNVRSEEDYDQYHVPRQFAPQISTPQVAATLDVNFDLVGVNLDVGGRRFSYRTTMSPNRRYGVLLNPEQVARREQVPVVTSLVSRDERSRRRTNPNDYRRNVYRYGVWATSLPDIFGRFRECSAEYYRREPNQLDRIVPWLNRELQVLLNNNAPHVAYVMQVIMEALSQYDMRSPEFRDIVRPYFGMHTDHFVHELLNYARTSFDLVGYDQYVTYAPSHGLSNDYVPRVLSPTSSSSSSSDDSDVRVVDETIDMSRLNAELPNVGPHTVDMPGPSTVSQAFHHRISHDVPDVLTISSNTSGSSDNECAFVGYVKPRHERTPEVIELSSSEVDEVNPHNTSTNDVEYKMSTDLNTCQQLFSSTNSSSSNDDFQQSTSHSRKTVLIKRLERKPTRARLSEISFSSTDDDSDSDSEYSPRRSRKSKSKSKKSSKTTSRPKRSKQPSLPTNRNKSSSKFPSSSDSELESSNKRQINKPELKPVIKRRYSSTWSDSSPDRSHKQSRSKGKSKTVKSQVVNVIKIRKDLIKKEEIYSDDSTKSSSSSDHAAAKSGDLRRRYYIKQCGAGTELRRTFRRCKSQTDDSSTDREISKRKSQTKKNKKEYSTSDSEKNLLDMRSGSQCSVRSDKTYASKKKSKHKDKRKEKREKRPSSKAVVPLLVPFQPSPSTSNTTNTTSTSTRNDIPSTSKHSDCKNNSSSKDRHRSHKKRKESKRRRSKSESKSRSKKKKRRVRLSSSSNSG